MIRRLLLNLFVPLALVSCGEGDKPSDVTSLDAPAGVACVNATDNSLEFSWTAVPGAQSYGYRLTAGSKAAGSGSTADTRVTVGSLEPETSYSFQVYAEAGSVRSTYSMVVTARTTGGTAPDPGTDPSVRTVCVDAPLVFEFAGPVTLGSSGLVQVFSSDGKVVDKIDLADLATVDVREDGIMVPKEKMTAETKFNTFMDAVYGASGCYRVVHYTPLRTDGRRLSVKLHSNVLEFGKSYYATVDKAVTGQSDARIDFAVKARPSGATFRVNPDGSGDFCTVQGAISHAATLAKNDKVTIEVGEGVYPEILYLRNKNNLTIKGAGKDKTKIAYANTENLCSSTGSRVSSRPALGAAIGNPGGRSLFLVESCDMLTLEDLSIENLIGSGDGQAECLYFNSSDKLVIEGCSLVSWQDTFETKGKVYVHNSLIAGHVDFIWGSPSACLFEDCEIRSRESGRYIVQARIPNASDKGFVFLNCRLTVENNAANVNLARANDHSKESTATYDNVTFIGCTMTGVAAAGWHASPAPNPAKATAVSGWKEYGSKDASGNALSTASRASCSRILTAAEAEPFSSREAVLGW